MADLYGTPYHQLVDGLAGLVRSWVQGEASSGKSPTPGGLPDPWPEARRAPYNRLPAGLLMDELMRVFPNDAVRPRQWLRDRYGKAYPHQLSQGQIRDALIALHPGDEGDRAMEAMNPAQLMAAQIEFQNRTAQEEIQKTSNPSVLGREDRPDYWAWLDFLRGPRVRTD